MGSTLLRLLTDRANAPRIRRTQDGVEGRRVWRVYTADPMEASLLVPQIGAAWSPTYNTLYVADIDARTETARDELTGQNIPGTSLVDVTYRTFPRTGSGSELPPSARQPGSAWTQYLSGESTVTVRTDLEDRLIANGQGAAIPVALLTAEVTVFQTSPPPLPALIALRRAVNSNAFAFPPIFGTAWSYTVQPGQARFAGWEPFRVDPETGVFEIVYRFELAEDHKFRWVKVNADDEAEEEVVSTVIEAVAFPTLWTL